MTARGTLEIVIPAVSSTAPTDARTSNTDAERQALPLRAEAVPAMVVAAKFHALPKP